MEEKFYIQRDGEYAKNIWDFFKIDANRGFADSAPSEPIEGDTYVDPTTGIYYIYEDEAWVSYNLQENQYVYCGVSSVVNTVAYPQGTYKYSDEALILDYNYKGISVSQTDDVNKFPDRKKPYSEDWKDEQGLDSYISQNTFYKDKEVDVYFLIEGDTSEEVRLRVESFMTFISAEGYVNYFDTYRNNGFRGYYKSHKIERERYNTVNYHYCKITFVVDRLCFGYYSLKCPLISVDINPGKEGNYELYASDGTSGKFDKSAIFNGNFEFIIVVPDYAGMLTLSCVSPNVVGFEYAADDNVVGLHYDNEDYVIGL